MVHLGRCPNGAHDIGGNAYILGFTECLEWLTCVFSVVPVHGHSITNRLLYQLSYFGPS